MTARRRALAPACAVVLATLGSWPAVAAEGACAAPTLEADAAIVSAFPDLLEQIRTDMARPDIDACARVDLRANGETIQISVSLPDGRAATRAAQRHEDVLPTLQALLVLPQTPLGLPVPAARTAAVAAPRTAYRPTPARLLQRESDRTSAPLATHLEPRSLGFELSLLGGPRMGEGQLAVGLGALSFLEVHGWLLGFTSRVDRYQVLLNGDPEMALELGFLAGKRLHFRHFALDFSAGPVVAMKGLALSSTEVAQVHPEGAITPLTPEDPGTGPVPRLLLGIRAGLTPRDVLRSFAGIEASLGPARADDTPNPDSAKFPVFALGLVLGGTVGTR